MISEAEDARKLSKVEAIKAASHSLRGTILEGLADTSTGAIAQDDTQLTKFHGIYQQDDRDLRTQRRKEKREKAYSFMVRIRVPGGVCTPTQWLVVDRLADEYGNGTVKLTTRQAFQLHGILKGVLKPTIKAINATLLDTLAACGDVNRNVMCNPNPYQSEVHSEVLALARAMSAHLSPRTHAYHEIWLDDQRVDEQPRADDEEPLYGKTYLPRKFKTVIAVPPSNDVDVFAHCLGFIAIIENSKIVGYNVTVGGGMGMTHGKKATFPRLADVMGFCTPAQVVDVAEKVVIVQRDYGDRSDRTHARLKYTIEDRGIDWFRSQVESHLGYKLGAVRPFRFDNNVDRYGWLRGIDGNWHLNLFIQNGRIKDTEGAPLKTGLREIAKVHEGDFRLTPNQNLIICGISDAKRPQIQALLQEYCLDTTTERTGLRLNSMACVALPTCGLALAESERFLPSLLDQLDVVIKQCGLHDDGIVIRMTGCPNGCARPYLGEIGIVGRAPGKYHIYLGAGFDGARLNKLYKQAVPEDQILATLTPILQRYADERQSGERFGDFVIRTGYVNATSEGRDFHNNVNVDA